ncbi:hypothetical protein PENTCL1PPCAC_4648, partial [Pristionchus entomophagus]
IRWSAAEARQERNMYYVTVQRKKELNMDKKEYILLKAIISCNPALEDLSKCSREIMQEQRDRHAKSLMSYIMARRGSKEGPLVYTEIMAYTDWLTRLIKRHKVSTC